MIEEDFVIGELYRLTPELGSRAVIAFKHSVLEIEIGKTANLATKDLSFYLNQSDIIMIIDKSFVLNYMSYNDKEIKCFRSSSSSSTNFQGEVFYLYVTDDQTYRWLFDCFERISNK